MTWFTENPWPPIFILGLAACVMLAVWSAQKRGLWLMGSLTAIAAAVAVFVVEKMIVTDAERVEKKVVELVNAFVRDDRPTVLSSFSVQAPELRELAQQGMQLVQFPNGIDVKDMHVRLTNENSRAIAHFRANGVVVVRALNTQHSMATRWEVTWQKEAGDWKIVEVVRLHPLKEERMPILDQRGQ